MKIDEDEYIEYVRKWQKIEKIKPSELGGLGFYFDKLNDKMDKIIELLERAGYDQNK